ncbi:MAG: hypothetical protein ACLUNO_04915 [Oscillospiraceae bacterium]
MNNSNGKTRRLAGLALFTAIVVVLQLLGSFIKVGPFAVSLVLIPIVVGAAVYGVNAGAWLGFVFGVVVTIAVVTGADARRLHHVFRAPGHDRDRLPASRAPQPACVAGARLSRHRQKHSLAGVIVAAAAAPVVNTGPVRARHGAVLPAAAAGVGRRHALSRPISLRVSWA